MSKTKELILSKSRVLLYKQCPLKYKFRYVDKIPTPTPDVLLRGIRGHELVEDFFNYPTVEEAIKNVKSHKHFAEFMEKVPHIVEFAKKAEKPPTHRELKITDPEEKIIGIVDAVFEYGKQAVVVDYKTGKFNFLDKYRLELAIYTHLVRKELGVEPTHWGIFFIDQGHFSVEPIKQEEIDKALELVKKTRKGILAEKFPKQINPYCKWCEFKDICETMK